MASARATLVDFQLAVAASGTAVTQAGAYLELGRSGLRVTLAGAYLELGTPEAAPPPAASGYQISGSLPIFAAYPDVVHPPVLGPFQLEGETRAHILRLRGARPGRAFVDACGLQWWNQIFPNRPWQLATSAAVEIYDPEQDQWVSGSALITRPQWEEIRAPSLYQELMVELTAFEAASLPVPPPASAQRRVSLAGLYLEEHLSEVRTSLVGLYLEEAG